MNPDQFGQNRDLNTELSEYEYSVMNFDHRYALYIRKLYHWRTSQSAGAGIRASTYNRCNCENSGSPASAYVMGRHYFVTYTHSLHAINGLLKLERFMTLVFDL